MLTWQFTFLKLFNYTQGTIRAEHDRYTLRVLASTIKNFVKVILSVITGDLIHRRFLPIKRKCTNILL